MQRSLLIVLVLAVSFVSVVGQTKQPEQSATEQAIVQLTRDWLAAEERHDRPKLQRIIADDFEGIGPTGIIVFKDDVMPVEGSEGGLAIEATEIRARVFGETAVVTGRGTPKTGEKRNLRFTVVFAKRDKEWRMVAGHLSAIPS